MRKIVIGTRASILAVAQAELTKKLLLELDPNLSITLKKIVTTGDKDQRTNWGNNSLKSLWTKEIEKDLLDETIDLAVHSMKDMPSISPKGLIIGGIPKREDNRDVFISKTGKNILELPKGAIIGTSSLRRQESLKALRKDLVIKPIRGNIHTRLKKLKEENYDGIILAAAGLKRVKMEDAITHYLDINDFVPAPAQGILAIQCRENDDYIKQLLKKITHNQTFIINEGEREFSKIFDGGCHTPMGCSIIKENEIYKMIGMYVKDKLYKASITGTNPKKMAQDLANIIREEFNER